jgi:HD-like signal output (HDOD) protein
MDPEHVFQRIVREYQIPCASSLPGSTTGQRVPALAIRLVECEQHTYLVLYPASQNFSLERFSRAFGSCRLVEETPLVGETDASDEPLALNSAGHVHLLIDEALSEAEYLLYPGDGKRSDMIIALDPLLSLNSADKMGLMFTETSSVNEPMPDYPGPQLADRLRQLHELPPMPETVTRLLGLRDRHEVNASYLIDIIDKDPVLTAQIISYANSAFFGQAGSVVSLKDAVFRVLGVNAVVDLALGLSVGRVLSIPHEGPLGARRLWRHAIYSAALMQKLALQMPWGERPDIGNAYLCGLLHDIGLFVLGHLFREEHASLSRLANTHPGQDIHTLEYRLMGVSHCELGQMAMRLWQMPAVLTAVVRHHHDPGYAGEEAVLVRLLSVVECLLAPHGLTDTVEQELDEALLAELGLEEETVILAADAVIQSGETLEQLAGQLCA